MKNTKSRKKILLSSVAMLLVALVALGSATYAWFTLNKTVTADAMTVSVSAAKGLQITGKNGSEWKKSYTFSDTSAALSPASLSTAGAVVSEKTVFAPAIDVDGKWNDVTDTEKTAKFDDVNTIKPATTNEAFTKNDYMAAYEIGVKSSSGTLSNVTQSLKITTEGNCAKYARVALIDQGFTTTTTANDTPVTTPIYGTGGSTVVATYGNQDGTGNNAPEAFANKTDAAAKTAVAQSLTAFSSGTSFDVTTTLTVTEVPHYYTVLIWYEGEDNDCITDKADGTINAEMSFSFV